MSNIAPSILTADTVPAYLTERSEEIGFFSAGAKLIASPILGGNVNYAFQVIEEGTDKSIFVKQAPEFVAVFGPDGYPLTSQRMQKEIDVYNEWRDILGETLEKRYLPRVYLFDAKNMVFVMQFFDGFDLLDHELVGDVAVSSSIAAGLGEFMGKTHSATHSSKVSVERSEYLTSHFENRAMREIQLEWVFSKCYREATDEQRAGLTVDEAFMKEIEILKSAYDGKNADNLVLSHGDLHPGSVMVNLKTDEVKVIDPEFTVYGPPGLDVGSVLSGYVLAAVHQSYSGNNDSVKRVCESATAVWESYCDSMIEGGISPEMMKKIEVESVGFTVAEVCRTALEFAGDRKWLQFENAETKADSKKAALKIVGNCMVERHSGGMKLMLDQIKALSK